MPGQRRRRTTTDRGMCMAEVTSRTRLKPWVLASALRVQPESFTQDFPIRARTKSAHGAMLRPRFIVFLSLRGAAEMLKAARK